MEEKLSKQLQTGAKVMGYQLTDHQVSQLMAYLGLLQKWNKAFNLTAIRNPQEMVEKHLLDSLSINGRVVGGRLLDVGTGAGLPGMIMAIMHPETSVTLLDSNGKKTRFLHQVKTELGLSNVEVVNSRVEQFKPDHLFDQITSRAFASIKDMLDWTGHLVAKDGEFLAMKGIYPEQELAEMPQSFTLSDCQQLTVPVEMGERHLLIIKKL